MTCVCGQGSSTDDCCGRFLGGRAKPRTAEELMRSRYAAFVLGDVDYIMATQHSSTVGDTDRAGVEAWSRKSQWLGLQILSTERGGPDDDDGAVEFIARYNINGLTQTHHERAEFKKDGGRWFYLDGKMVGSDPVARAEPRIGRNDPCPCGSGKKYKKCCGRAA